MISFNDISFFYKRKIYPGFKVGKDELVVDVGSGDKPFWRADVFIDKLSLGNNQRASNSDTISHIGLFIDSDATRTPVKNKAFDFSFCSHLLEHVEKPDIVIKELMRISKRGYIEVPNAVAEAIRPFYSHLWFIYITKNNKLIFKRKSKWDHEINLQNGLRCCIRQGIDEPFIRYYWKNKIDYEIINNLKKEEIFSPIENKSKKYDTTKNTIYIAMIKILRLLFYKNKILPKNIYK